MFIYSHRQFRLKVSNEINIRDKAGKTLGLLYMLPVSFIFPGSFNLVKFQLFHPHQGQCSFVCIVIRVYTCVFNVSNI